MRSNKIHEGRSSTAFNIFNTALMCFMMLLVLYPIDYHFCQQFYGGNDGTGSLSAGWFSSGRL